MCKKDLVARVCVSIYIFFQQETHNPVLKWAKKLIKHFSKEGIEIDNKFMKRWSTSLVIREIQIKSTMSCQFIPIWMAIVIIIIIRK